MLIPILKFFHLICVLSLLGSTAYCLFLIGSKKFSLANNTHLHEKITRLNKILLGVGLLAMLTGTLLIYPKNFTFHTPWIQAAYLLVSLFGLGVFTLIKLNKKNWRGVRLLVYVALVMLLFTLIHDAVTKTTFIL
jgi:hypothetical protein